MKCALVLALGFALGASGGVQAQVSATPADTVSSIPATSTAPAAPLAITPAQRQYFQFGYVLSKAAFAEAELVKQAVRVSKIHGKKEQVRQLGKLSTLALHDRHLSYDGFVRALSLLRDLHASHAALAPLSRTGTRLRKPIVLTTEARKLAAADPHAATTLSVLHEFRILSAIPEHPALQEWLNSGPETQAGQVWYAEGVIAALADVASARKMPDLLPPAADLDLDLRGLRDWLDARAGVRATPDQRLLKKSLDNFLRQIAGAKGTKKLTLPQLAALGRISKKLQAQILSVPSHAPVAPQTTAFVTD